MWVYMQTIQSHVRLLLSVLSASTLFDKVGLLALKHSSKQKAYKKQSRLDWLLKVLLSDPETETFP